LVARHGPLVFGLCRRVLRDAHDAEDVFQATFLVLARKAASIRKPASLSCYLHGVAYRLALKVKAQAARRRAHEQRVSPACGAEESDLSWHEVRALIDEELQRLPSTERLPLILCYLEGQTQDEAARQLGWPRGTLKRRLERGRERLRLRLSRRGVSLGAGLFAAALSASTTRGAVPVLLRMATVCASMRFRLDEAGAVAATQPGLLVEAALKTMLPAKLKLGAVLLLLLGCVSAAAGLAIQPTPAEKQPENKAEAPAQAQPKANPVRPAEEKQVRKDQQGDPLPEGAIARLGTRLLRHTDMVASAVFTRDGKTAIVSSGGSLVYWDVATGQAVRRLQPRVAGYGLAISADGKTLASDGGSGLCLEDVATGKLLSHAKIVNDAIMQILFTPDGKTLVLRDQGPTIHLWDTAHNKQLDDLRGHTGSVACMALSPDGTTLASGSWKDPHIRLWDIATGKERCHFTTSGTDVLSLAFSPDGKTLAAISNVAGFAFFDPNTGKQLRKAKDYYGGVSQIVYAPDGKTLIGIASGTVHVLDAVSGKHLRKFDAPPRTMAGLTISPDGKTVATFWGGAHTFDLWDAASGKLLHSSPGHRHGITGLAFAADGKTLFSAAGITDYVLLAWDTTTGELRGHLGEHGNGYQGLALSPDGKQLVGCTYGDLRLWDPVSRKELRRFAGHKQAVVSAAWSPDGKTLVTSSNYDKSIRIWDAASGKERRTIPYKADWISEVALSPDGKLIAAGGYQDGTIHLWEADTGKELPPLATPQHIVSTLAFSLDGSTLASGGSVTGIHLWDLTTRQLRQRWGESAGVFGKLTFSRDGRTLVSGHCDGKVHLWEMATAKERACFSGHRGAVRAVAFARDGRRIASGSEDTTILIWDITSGTQPDAVLSAEQLQALWADLEGENAGRAYRAMWQLVVRPRAALPFLAERLRPVAALDADQRKQIARLLAKLDDEMFAVRQRAEAELEQMGASIEPALRQALERKPLLEVRRRIEKVLEKVAGSTGERLRLLRALEAIEQMDTPEARRLLDKLASGDPRAWMTQEARHSRSRLDGPR
jgi:RNA polymerase sigma factor (sigma-70 family)